MVELLVLLNIVKLKLKIRLIPINILTFEEKSFDAFLTQEFLTSL
nr:MAG TPA: hypothetical protein [Caudoviricetes sp.]